MNWLYGVWRGFRRDEHFALLACGVLLTFCAYFGYAQHRAEPPPPPFFVETSAAPRGQKPASSTVPTPTAVASGSAPAASAPQAVVHVAGAVRRPGLQRWPVGARVVDAVRAAGGATSHGDIQALNLAQRLRDGERIVVPERGGAMTGQDATTTGATFPSSSATAAATSRRKAAPFAGTINVNTATALELEALPGIGPALAARIVAYRSQKGRFSSIDDLDQVKGLGPKKLQSLREHVTF